LVRVILSLLLSLVLLFVDLQALTLVILHWYTLPFLAKTSIFKWTMVNLLHPFGLSTLLVRMISQILNCLQMGISLKPWLWFLYRGKTYIMIFVFFPFGRLSKLTINETLGQILEVGSTWTNIMHEL
jgi:hypothetical protein